MNNEEEKNEQEQKNTGIVYDPTKDAKNNEDEKVEEKDEPETASIEDFLAKNVASIDVKENVKLDRFKSPFVVRALSAEESDEIRKDCSHWVVNRRTGVKTRQLDSDMYSDELIVRSIVTPDLNNAELQTSYGTVGYPAETLRKMLSLGEYNQINKKVTELAGLNDDDINDDVEEVKK